MKSNIRFTSLLAAAILFLSFSLQAKNRNQWLTAQAFSMMDGAADVQVEYLKLNHWMNIHAKQIRMMDTEDANGSFTALMHFDTEGNLERIERPRDQVTLHFFYTTKGDLKRIEAIEQGVKTTQFSFFYDKAGSLTRGVLDDFDSKSQTEVWFDEKDNPIMQHAFKRGKLINQFEVVNTYNGLGQITDQIAGGTHYQYTYNAEGKLIQSRRTDSNRSIQSDLSFDAENLKSVKIYQLKGEEYKLQSTLTFTFDPQGRLAKESLAYQDNTIMGEEKSYNYDETWELTASIRGEGDFDVTYGYGTPVIMKWVTPEKDLRVTDSTQTLQLDLKPGVAQEMPDIVNITLRHNGKLTERKIGNVVLRKRGKANDYYIEETLPMMVGSNQIHLEVETQLGRFSSDERYITFQDPNALVATKNLHVLAIGIGDYEAEGYDTKFADADARDFSKSLMETEGKLFKKVEIKTLTNAEATRDNILEAVRTLKGKASEDDLAIVFFSGQGESFDGSYYLRAFDSGKDYLSLEATGIETKWLAEELHGFRSPVAAFFDASQHVVDGETPEVDLSTEVSIIKENFKSTIEDDDMLRMVLFSAQGEQKSLENKEWANGIFTESVVNGLNGAADEKGNGDGVVTFDELVRYVKDKVKDDSDYKQAPTSFEAGIGKIALQKK